METYIVLSILFIHWVADFICQTDKMALNKSKSNKWLTRHVFVYTLVTIFGWGCAFAYQSGFEIGLAVFAITFVTHWIIDYFTSRLNSYLWKKEMNHWFFTSIGFDQFIHYCCLLLTYKYLV